MLEGSYPIPKQSVGKTFVISISVLGLVAFAQFCVLGWAFMKRPRTAAEKPAAAVRPAAAATPAGLMLADPFAGAATTTPVLVLPKPQPIGTSPKPSPLATATPPPAAHPLEPTPEGRVVELVELARALRARGDTATTLTRLREAQAILRESPLVGSELAITYEKMGLADKAAEQWRKVYDMGESAGIYYSAAEAKLRVAESVAKPTPAAPEPAVMPMTAHESEGIQPGSVLGLVDLVKTDVEDANSSQKFTLRIPVKARPKSKIDVRDVVLQVFFYDILDNKDIVQTNANVSSRWTTLPADWADDDMEVLEVEYSQPKAEKKIAEKRKYYGYVVRIYYRTELQDMRADPVRLLKQFPPPLKLQADETK